MLFGAYKTKFAIFSNTMVTKPIEQVFQLKVLWLFMLDQELSVKAKLIWSLNSR